MVDAVIGAVIMVVATTSLLLAVEVTEDAFRGAGRYPVSNVEKKRLGDLRNSLLDRPNASGEGQMSQEILFGLEFIDNIRSRVVDPLPKQYLKDDEI